jgi:hypothetical protein
VPGLLANTHCNDPKTLLVWDVKSLGPRTNGNWSEIWKAQACGNVVYYRVEYLQGGGTTNITARLYTPPVSGAP